MKNNNLKIVKTDQNNKKIINGRWAKAQHDRFMKALEKFGRDWLKVQKFVKTRTLSQVRSHAQKVFLKMPDQDIQALIREQGDSAYSEKNDRFEIVKSRNVDIKSLNSKNSHIHVNNVITTKRSQITTRESLLDIFKRAIQHQTLELQSQNIRRHSTKQNKPIKADTLFSLRQHQAKAYKHLIFADQKNRQKFLQQPTQNFDARQKHYKNYKITQNLLANQNNLFYLPMNFTNIIQQLVQE